MTSELSFVPGSLRNIMSSTRKRLQKINDTIIAGDDVPMSSSTLHNLIPRATPRPAIRDNISSNYINESSSLLCSVRQGMFSKALYAIENIVTKFQSMYLIVLNLLHDLTIIHFSRTSFRLSTSILSPATSICLHHVDVGRRCT